MSKNNSLDLTASEVGSVRGGAPRFTLDSPVDDEGGNLRYVDELFTSRLRLTSASSIGQRSLVSLARALVKNSKILILDEPTASVDYETDRKIQDTIAHEFSDRTILCIAHRLRTIIGYDRICVLDAGRIAEFDTPANLFARPDSIFKSMCDKSSISADDIRTAASVQVTLDERGNYVRK
jgi:ABC-type multidrug transport system ATPase subunit